VELRTFIRELEAHYAAKGKELVVFIDTNPALSIYTQIALVAMTHLIVPVNADAFSMQV
jgi:cellulose biosynthesis protein BcsQ